MFVTVSYFHRNRTFVGKDVANPKLWSHIHGATTLSIITLSIMTLSIMTLSIMTLSIMTLSIMTLSAMGLIATLSTKDIQHSKTHPMHPVSLC